MYFALYFLPEKVFQKLCKLGVLMFFSKILVTLTGGGGGASLFPYYIRPYEKKKNAWQIKKNCVFLHVVSHYWAKTFFSTLFLAFFFFDKKFEIFNSPPPPPSRLWKLPTNQENVFLLFFQYKNCIFFPRVTQASSHFTDNCLKNTHNNWYDWS